MNLNLYGHAGKWLMVDLGVTFADDTMPGVEVIMPDPAFIEERRADLVGIVLTHAHEDHLGAVAYSGRGSRPGLCHAVHRLGAAPQAARGRPARRRADHRDPAGRQVQPAAVRARADHHDPLDPRAQRAGDPHASSARCSTPATGRSTPSRCWARSPTRRRCGASATRACWPWCATAPTSSSRARRARKPTVRANLEKLVKTAKAASP